MKKSVKKTHGELVDIPPFDFDHSAPNKFAARYQEGVETIIHTSEANTSVTLEPDVAAYFPDSERVNAALRALISALSTINLPPAAERTHT